MQNKLLNISLIIYIVKSLFVVIFSLYLQSVNVFIITLILDVVFYLISTRKGHLVFLSYCFFTLIAFLLYSSYLLESGSYCTYGGDDEAYFKMVQNALNDDTRIFSIQNFLNNRYSSYIYLSYFLLLPFKLVGLQIDFPITLALFHAAVGSLIIPIYNSIFRKLTGISKIPFSLFLFTPIIYYSIVNREVINYLIYGVFIYYIISNYNWFINIIRLIVSFTLMYFVRPETSFSLGIFLFFNSINSLKKVLIFGLSFLSILFVYQFFTKNHVTAIDQGQLIYFQLPQANISQSSIGSFLRYATNPIIKCLNYFYYVMSPIPPYVIRQYNFENIFLSIGQILWYCVLFSLIRNWEKLAECTKNRIFIANLLVLLIYVFIVAFYGGTQRHYYTFVPIVLMSFDFLYYNNETSFIRTVKEIVLIIPIMMIGYFTIKLML
jgi:hypothetical protein